MFERKWIIPEYIEIKSLIISGDENVVVRQKAVEFIVRLRNNNTPTASQDFVLPKLNEAAESYHSMIYYEKIPGGRIAFKAAASHGAAVHRSKMNRLVTEPPLTRPLTETELYSYVVSPMATKFQCHAQPCERGVKLTSDSTKGCRRAGYEKHLGTALMASRSRKEEGEIRALKLFD